VNPERAWVVIAAYNEAKVLRPVVEGVLGVVPNVVVVYDGSRDHTAAEAIGGGATVLRHIVNLGQGAALETGIRYALAHGADFVFTYDADGQHSPHGLYDLARVQAETGADVVLGSRFLGRAERMPAARRILLKAAVAFTRLHCGLPVTDTHNGLRLFTRRAASLIRLTQPRMAHASEILSQIRTHHLQFAEAPVTVSYSEYSLEKGQSMGDAFRILLDILYSSLTR